MADPFLTKDPSVDDIDGIDWTSEDEREIEDIPAMRAATANIEASSSSVSPCSKLIQNFVGMGFSRELVEKAIEQSGEDSESILETLLTLSVLETSPSEQPYDSCPQEQPCVNENDSSSGYDENIFEDFSDTNSWSEEDVEDMVSMSDKERTLLFLTKMGYPAEEATVAMDRCGPEATIEELTDFMCAAEMARSESTYWQEDDIKPKLKSLIGENGKHKRKMYSYEMYKKKKQRGMFDEEVETIRLPKPMVGFGVPTEICPQFQGRTLPEQALGPPYFYYENVALAPKGVWDTISRFLYDVEPEFVDSKYFCAAARKRGYIHNLPVENRFPLLPIPPRTIHEALPLTKKWWPSWDTRTKLNCLQTAIGSARLSDRIRKAVEAYEGEPPLRVQKYVLDECRKWNLVWVGRNKAAPLEPDEIEYLLGFPKNHTRGGGISRTDRYKSLGNSFQVDTVAYHLSTLKDLFPGGMNVLSLFSGIGGAEVALHKLGIRLKTVVSVEKSEVNRNIVRSWWEQTNQTGNLIDFDDVQLLNADRLEQLIHSTGGFDLVIGGSPCNNLAGSNRVSRDGLEGKESSLFYDYIRILDLVKSIMSGYQ
ncbi:unnamed protein product [Cuscuta campestris]|uniref:DNA (cytosine-5-)-methyltransferase n=2 Tax=Cuscuta sect. Cleistogrammica TaxID=1824901 RepID=A0A484L6G5_9ASTE|nr:hypothetical protein DM860_007163 [Cuscuta australis]VFQ71929.1 unnamed protein product [Cuscuta campestris]